MAHGTKVKNPTDRFALAIDGHHTTVGIRSAEGGNTKAAVIDERIGPDNQIKHKSVADVEPLMLEFGLAGSRELLKWASDGIERHYARRTISLSRLQADGTVELEMEGFDGIITEFTVPKLDRNAKGEAAFQTKIQFERTRSKLMKSGQHVDWAPTKPFKAAGFAFKIDGIDKADAVTVIDSFTIKSGIKTLYVGSERLPTIEPTKVEFPDLTIQIPMAAADPFMAWHKEAAAKEMRSRSRMEKSGSVEFRNGTDTIFAIRLYEVMLHTLVKGKGRGFQGTLSVGRMEIDLPNSLG